MAIQLKIGDVVHVRGTVVKMLDREVCLDVGEHHYFWIPSGRVVHVEPAPLKVGDRVAWQVDGIPRTLIAIDDAMAWVRCPGRDGIIVRFDQLERADEPRPLKVGDKVRHVRGANTGTVIAIGPLDGITIIKWDCGMGDALERTDNLERVE